MTKRQKLDYDSEELTRNLKQSAGKGVDALFSSPSPAPEDVRDTDKQDNGTEKPSNHDTVVSRHHDTAPSDPVEVVRKAVKDVGKEAATHRFTPEEKQQLVDIIYSYSRQGYKTSENEITRIAINWLILDHQEQGKNSILNKVLTALNE